MAGVAGGCLGIEPITEAGDSVIRVRENISDTVAFADAQPIVETISETVTVVIT